MHLDEVRKLLVGTVTEADQPPFSCAVHRLAAAVRPDSFIALFPSSTSRSSKTQVLRTASAAERIPISLPLLTAEHYADILRRLFCMAQDWTPPAAALAYVLRCLEGPPRLLLLFLWAAQASGPPVTENEIFATKVDCQLMSAKLQTLSWAQPSAILLRCLHSLENGRLVTFTATFTHKTSASICFTISLRWCS